MKPVLSIVGGGMGDEMLLSGIAKQTIEQAVRLYVPARLKERISGINPGVQVATTTEICAALQDVCVDTAVVVSGDVGFYSLSDTLQRAVGERYDLRMYNGVSSLAYLCAKLGKPYQTIKVLSLHGRSGSLCGAVSYHPDVFVLTGGKNTVAKLMQELVEAGLAHVTVTVGENLSAADECIVKSTPEALMDMCFSGIAVVLIENPRPADPTRRLRDEDFVRGDVPMTKEIVRTASVARLDVRPADTVWDVGAGTGAVSAALAFAARDGAVYAIERNPQALSLLHQNRQHLGAHNMRLVEAEAPDGLEALPDPDRVFIGGSGGNMRQILQQIHARAHRYTVCINAVTLESVAEAMHVLEDFKFDRIEVSCVNVSTARTMGNYHLMSAQNPVYIMSGEYQP